MTKFNKTWTLGLLAAASIGCGGDANKPQVTNPDDSNGATNGATNSGSNGSTNVATNGSSNNATNSGMNNETNNDTNNNTNNNTTEPPLMGTVRFGGSSDTTWYTNGVLAVEIEPGEGAGAIELVLGDDEVLVEFGDETEYRWDTSAMPEGEYSLKLRYMLGDSVRWSDDERTVVVDRVAPQLADSTPTANADAASDAALTMTFDEPIDPASVDSSTVLLELTGGQTPAYAPSLSADGLTITIDFDRNGIAPPYSTLVSIDGVTDLAGNTTMDGFSYTVPAWFDTSFSASISDLHYFTIGSSRYVVGVSAGMPADTLRVYELTNRQGASFQEVASMAAGQVYDIAADEADGKIHIAALRNTNANGIIVKSVQLLEYDPSDDSLVESGSRGIGMDSNNGAVALDMRTLNNETRGAIAVVSNESLSVYNFSTGTLSDATASSFPSGSYSFVRDEDLAVHVRQDSFTDVAFAKCTNSSDPCYRTQMKHLGDAPVAGWTEYDLNVLTPLADSNSCDEYINFDAVFSADILTIFASYERCTGTESEVSALTSDDSGTADVTSADIMGTTPALPDVRYTTHVAGEGQALHTMLASRTELFVASVGPTSVTWLSDVAADLDTDTILLLKRIRNPRLYTNADDKPVVVFRHGGNVHIRTAN